MTGTIVTYSSESMKAIFISFCRCFEFSFRQAVTRSGSMFGASIGGGLLVLPIELNKISGVIPNVFASTLILATEGSDLFASHLLTAVFLHESFSASSSCVQSMFLRADLMISPKLMIFTMFFQQSILREPSLLSFDK